MQPRTSSWTFLWFALWTGVSAACIYVCQPLLHTIGAELALTDQRAGLIATATQVGYGLGIFTLVPLGDFLPRRRLVVTKLLLLATATVACAVSPSLTTLVVASFFVGVFATTAQDLVPIAAELAPPLQRGRYVGYVMSGLMLGILLSRTASGWIAGAWGWRAAFVAGGGAALVCAATTMLFFPALAPRAHAGSIARVYGSMLVLLRAHPTLRVSVVRHGAMGFAFSAFWTTIAFFLSGPPYGWSAPQIGAMGLAGAAGVVASTLAGRLADARGPLFAIRIATIVGAASFAAMGAAGTSAFVLITGTVLFDVAVQSSLVSHQSIIYALDPTARARINGIFVSALFLCFSIGSLVSAFVWSRWGWGAVMGAACAACAASFALTFVTAKPRAA